MATLRLTARARRDIDAILRRSNTVFGEDAAERYRTLLIRALQDVRTDPLCPGVRLVHTRRQPVLLYALKSVRAPIAPVREPRHFLAFQHMDGVVTVLRVLHERMDLPAHLR
ncbi:type II toxin-antitoxin system RelE/ParE family toxin [Brevundimonas sp.]|uniref:type II toxin-antitoxin system RelE/ParE family toxin n=1 Tax=Brevundimonas sp. TaxID=1871086 RepID=UPI002ED98BC8